HSGSRETLPIDSGKWQVVIALALVLSPFVFLVTLGRGEGGSSSIRFTVSSLILSMAAFGLFVWRRREWRGWGVPDVLLAGVGGLYLLSCLAHLSGSSLAKGAQFFAAAVLPYLAIRWAARSERGRRRIAGSLALAATLAGALALVQLLSGQDGFLVRGGLPNNPVYGLFLLLTMPYLTSWIGRRLNQRARIRSVAALGAFLVLSMTLRDTGQLLAFLLEGVVLVFFLVEKKRALLAVPILILAVLGLHGAIHREAAARFVSPHEAADLHGAFERQYVLSIAEPRWSLALGTADREHRISLFVLPVARSETTMESGFQEGVLKQRYAEWIAAARMAAAHPLLGVGPGGYQNRIGRYYGLSPKQNTSEPDTQNGWLVLGATTGLVGLGFMMAALLLLTTSSLSGLRISHSKVSCGTGAPACAEARLRPAESDCATLSKENMADPIESKSLSDADRSAHLAVAAAGIGLFVGGFWSPLLQAGTLVPLAAWAAIGSGFVADRRPIESFGRSLRRNRVKWSAAAVALLVALFFYPRVLRSSSTDGTFLEEREAEEAIRFEPPVVRKSIEGARKGLGIEIPRGAGAGWRREAAGQVVYDFATPEDGFYRLWARARWTDGCGNSFFVRVDNETTRSIGNDAVFENWHWVSLEDVFLTAGGHRLEFSNREDGVALDRWILTNRDDFDPDRTELALQPDFFDGFGGCDGQNYTSWRTEGGIWKVFSSEADGFQDSFGQFGLGHAIALAGKETWSDYNVSCMIRSGTENGIGLLFHYRGERDHDAVRWAGPGSSLPYAGSLELVRKRNGVEEVLASVPEIPAPDEWHSLEVKKEGENLLVFVDETQILASGRVGDESGQVGLMAEENPAAFFDNVSVEFER
ncbi:O-antigen ligase family protein, partial [bacterium]|nr:O-antigen ligase family protein [bacterium]